MEKAQIVHNPTSGDEEHSRKKIEKIVEKVANVINYVSTEDEHWEKNFKYDSEVIFLAGGDGTVRKLATYLFDDKKKSLKTPIYLLPYGTANNIALTLDIPKKIKEPEPDFEKNIKDFDIGRIKGLGKLDFFLEGVGLGIFPELMRQMTNKEMEVQSASEEIQQTLKVLLEISKNFEASKAKLNVDGIKIKGSFLMVELINIKYIGPNFQLAPNADPGDGFFDLILIPEARRVDLVSHLQKVIDGKGEPGDLKDVVQHLRVKEVKMKWKGKGVHVDDDLVEDYSGEDFEISIDPGELKFVKQE